MAAATRLLALLLVACAASQPSLPSGAGGSRGGGSRGGGGLARQTEGGGQPRTFCNPLNLGYRFRLELPSRREAADPTMVVFDRTYFLFASKSGGYWHSPDLLSWTLVEPTGLPLEDYAPTVFALHGRLYFTAAAAEAVFTTDDPIAGRWSKVASLNSYKDPCLFLSGERVLMYHGAGPNLGLSVVELDPTNGWKEVRLTACLSAVPLLSCLSLEHRSGRRSSPSHRRTPARSGGTAAATTTPAIRRSRLSRPLSRVRG